MTKLQELIHVIEKLESDDISWNEKFRKLKNIIYIKRGAELVNEYLEIKMRKYVATDNDFDD